MQKSTAPDPGRKGLHQFDAWLGNPKEVQEVFPGVGLNGYYFKTNADREKALAKWRAWAKENLKPKQGDAAPPPVEKAAG